MKTYEGMFLLDAGQTNFDEAVQPIRTVMERSKAEVIVMKKWDERRLAYEIRGRRRGLYVLTYFKADPEVITAIERDVQLSEDVLRVLILAADHMSTDDMAAPVPAESEASSRSDAPDREDSQDVEADAPAEKVAKKADEAKVAEQPAEAKTDEAAAPEAKADDVVAD